MEDNKHQFDVFDYEEDGSFKPIFMLGKCQIEKDVDPIYEVADEEHGTIDTIKCAEISNPTAPVKTSSFLQNQEAQPESRSFETPIQKPKIPTKLVP